MLPAYALPAAISALGLGAWYSKSRKKVLPSQELLAARRSIFLTAINSEGITSKQMRELATAFRNEEMFAEAKFLELRADLKDAPKELTYARREAYKKAMNDATNPDKIRNLAKAFDEIGATGAADNLRKRADELEKLSEPGPSKPMGLQNE